jgi:hypothetical protein
MDTRPHRRLPRSARMSTLLLTVGLGAIVAALYAIKD